VQRGGEVWAFRVPEVLLLVLGEDLAFVGDEGCDIEEGRVVLLDNSSRYDTDI